MLIGYARVSTDDQNLDLQRDALRLAGCEKIYEDRISGAKAARPGLAMALEVARAGDVLTVWRLDRLGRSLHDLILLGRKLDEMGIGLMSVQEKIDTSSSGGRLAGFTHQTTLTAKPARQPRALVWKQALPSASVKLCSCWAMHNAQPLISDA